MISKAPTTPIVAGSRPVAPSCIGISRALARILLAAMLSILAIPAYSVEIIAHRGVPLTELPHSLARLIFASKVTRWADGSPVRVFVLADDSPLHQDLCKGVLDLYPYQLRAAWDRIIYTGIGQAPILVANEVEMRKQVATIPGAIGYVGRGQKNDNVQVLHVR